MLLIKLYSVFMAESMGRKKSVLSHGRAVLHLAVSAGRFIGRSLILHYIFEFRVVFVYSSYPTVRGWIAVYLALFQIKIGRKLTRKELKMTRKKIEKKRSSKGNDK